MTNARLWFTSATSYATRREKCVSRSVMFMDVITAWISRPSPSGSSASASAMRCPVALGTAETLLARNSESRQERGRREAVERH